MLSTSCSPVSGDFCTDVIFSSSQTGCKPKIVRPNGLFKIPFSSFYCFLLTFSILFCVPMQPRSPCTETGISKSSVATFTLNSLVFLNDNIRSTEVAVWISSIVLDSSTTGQSSPSNDEKQEENKSENSHRGDGGTFRWFTTEAVKELLSLWFCVEREHSWYGSRHGHESWSDVWNNVKLWDVLWCRKHEALQTVVKQQTEIFCRGIQ